jgi:DNA-binding CsgD family transcriptional regulator
MKEVNQSINVSDTNVHGSNFSEPFENTKEKQPVESLILSHTKVEQALYELMFAETRKAMSRAGAFSLRYLMVQTGIYNYSSLRRAKTGLINKLSIEREKTSVRAKSSAVMYIVYSPTEILARRRRAGFNPYPKELTDGESANNSGQLIEQLVHQHDLSRRQAQVALKCAEGLSNAEIGAKLLIGQETVKFHLRNIFVKFGVKRRAELIAYLFRQELTGLIDRN